jgi:hypothetical protein
LDESSLY